MSDDDAARLRREVTTLMFDQYGTVVDMQGGLIEMVTPFLARKGWRGEPHRFVTWWRRTHFEDSMTDSLCDRGHTSYREIGQRAVAQVMRRAGIDHTPDEVRWLVACIERLKPFPDVLDALGRLRARYRLAILSNGDRDMLEAAKPHIGFDFDAVISVEEAGYFQAASRHLRRRVRAARRRPDERPLRRQPRVRLHRRQGLRPAHGVHRPPPASLRRLAPPARPHRRGLRSARRGAVSLTRLCGVELTVGAPRTRRRAIEHP